MGRDKALLPVGSTTLVENIAARLSELAAEPTLVGQPGRYTQLGLPVLDERYPGCGPLSGIESALRQTRHPWNFILSCDIPDVPLPVLRALRQRAASTPADAVIPQNPDGRLEPLCAIYHVRCLPSVEKALIERRWKVLDCVASLNFEPWMLDAGTALRLANVNTPEDWAAHSAGERGA